MLLTNDPQKIDAALAELEAERERRIQMKIDAGEIEPSLIVVGAHESVPEVELHNCVVITGVLRAGRDDAYSEKLARGPKIEPPDERYRSYAPEEAPTAHTGAKREFDAISCQRNNSRA